MFFSIQKELKKPTKKLLKNLIMMKLSFLYKKKILAKLKKKTPILGLMCLVMKMGWFFQFTFQIKNLKTPWICCFQLMMINHIMYTLKTLTDLCFTKQKIKTRNTCLQCFSSKNVLTEHKEDCLSINGKQSVKLEKGTIEFENYFQQIPVPFKIYPDFDCNLEGVESYEGCYTKNIKITFLVVLLIKLFALIISLVSQLLFLEVKMLLMNLLKQFLRSMSNAKK